MAQSASELIESLQGASSDLKVVAALHPKVDDAVLRFLLEDPDPKVQASAYDVALLRPDLEFGKLFLGLADPQASPQLLRNAAKHDLWGIQKKAASHENCPPDALRLLARHKEKSVRAAVASNPNTPEEVRITLSPLGNFICGVLDDTKTADEVWMSAHPLKVAVRSTNPTFLRALAEHGKREVRMCVASNPNSPLDVLKTLIEEFPEDVFRNPSAPSDMIEDLIKRGLDPQPHSFDWHLSNANIPRSYALRQLEEGPYRQSAGNNPNLTAEDLTHLYYKGCWVDIAGNPNCPPHILRMLEKRLTGSERKPLASNPSCPADVLTILHKEDNLRSLAYINPSHPINFFTLRNKIRTHIANGEGALTTPLLTKLEQQLSGNPDLSSIANSEHVSPATLDKLAWNNNSQVRVAVASNPNTRSATLDRLALEDSDYLVCNAALANPNLSRRAMRNAIALKDPGLYPGLTSNPRLPIGSLEELSSLTGEEVEETLTKIALNPQTPPSILEDLGDHPNKGVQLAVACNPNTFPGTLWSLANSEDTETMTAAIFHRNFDLKHLKEAPQSILDHIVHDDRRLHPRRSHRDLLDMVARHHPSYRLRVAKHSLTPAKTLKFLLSKAERDVGLQAAVAAGQCSVELFETLYDLNIDPVLEQLALNPNSPLHIIRKLAQSSSHKVRLNVAQNFRASSELLENLLEDDVYEVVQAAEKNIAAKDILHGDSVPVPKKVEAAPKTETPIKRVIANAVASTVINRITQAVTGKELLPATKAALPAVLKSVSSLEPLGNALSIDADITVSDAVSSKILGSFKSMRRKDRD